MKVINPRGVQIDIPDDWKGVRLQQMIAEGYEVIPEKVVIEEPKPIEIKQQLEDKEEIPEEFKLVGLPTGSKVTPIPEDRIRYINKDGRLKRAPGHGKPSSKRIWAATKGKVKNG